MMPNLVAPLTSGLPVDERSYPRFPRGPLWRPWRGFLALGFGIVACLIAMVVGGLVGMAIDAHGRPTTATITGPAGFISNNLGIACCIPIAIVLGSVFFVQPRGFASSVAGRFRWRWFGICALVILPLWLIFVVGGNLLSWQTGQLDLHISSDTWVLLAGIVLTTPLQCAGEEYAFRSLINRSVGCLVPNRYVGLLLGAVVSSGLFMLAHSAGDPWLNLTYFYFGLASCWLCWRTGGLEASFALHLVNNMTALLFIPFTGGLSGVFDRADGTGSIATAVIQAGIITGAVVLIEVMRTFRHPLREAAPGRALLPPPVWYMPQPTPVPSPWAVPASWPSKQ